MSGSTLRILDANLNRAREALRVVEDYARFALDDDRICAELKDLRHQLADATAGLAAEAVLHRDTPGDVGTDNKVRDELVRDGAGEVVTAAGKRLGEAMRTIEEYLKTIDPAAAATVELIRYRFYDVEMRIARTLRPAELFAGVTLYVLITEALCAPRPWQEVAEAAIAGGADCLQLREKDLESGELLRRAKDFVRICRQKSVISIINDRPDIAVLSDADGVHVGQTDLPAIEARKIVGRDRIVGVSTHTLEQARQAVLDGADYIGVGPVFPSQTKPRGILPGLEFAKSAAAAVKIPCIAIAGITPENVERVMQTGVSGVAVSSAILSASDVRAAAGQFRKSLSIARRCGVEPRTMPAEHGR
jgi:thiamine-phosphate pyrophosphorylase